MRVFGPYLFKLSYLLAFATCLNACEKRNLEKEEERNVQDHYTSCLTEGYEYKSYLTIEQRVGFIKYYDLGKGREFWTISLVDNIEAGIIGLNKLYDCRLDDKFKIEGLKIIVSGDLLDIVCKPGQACPAYAVSPFRISHIEAQHFPW